MSYGLFDGQVCRAIQAFQQSGGPTRRQITDDQRRNDGHRDHDPIHQARFTHASRLVLDAIEKSLIQTLGLVLSSANEQMFSASRKEMDRLGTLVVGVSPGIKLPPSDILHCNFRKNSLLQEDPMTRSLVDAKTSFVAVR